MNNVYPLPPSGPAAAASELAGAVAAATLDTARLRETALTLAVSHFKKITWTGDPTKIVVLAEAFYQFLTKGA